MKLKYKLPSNVTVHKIFHLMRNMDSLIISTIFWEKCNKSENFDLIPNNLLIHKWLKLFNDSLIYGILPAEDT